MTADAITARVGPPPVPKFFNGPEEACARALLNLLTGQDAQHDELTVPVLEMVDARLSAGETDGWRYDDMPEDGQAWRDTLAFLDADASPAAAHRSRTLRWPISPHWYRRCRT